jgi:hypothetical protein
MVKITGLSAFGPMGPDGKLRPFGKKFMAEGYI